MVILKKREIVKDFLKRYRLIEIEINTAMRKKEEELNELIYK